jgi:hypothetical protein
MRNPRLPADNYTFTIGKSETHPGWPVTVSLCRHPRTGAIKEIVFLEAGKAGTDSARMFADLGIGLSRILSKRDPQTGEALRDD